MSRPSSGPPRAALLARVLAIASLCAILGYGVICACFQLPARASPGDLGLGGTAAPAGSRRWVGPGPGPAPGPEWAVVSVRGNGPGRSARPLGPAVAAALVSLIGFATWVASIVLLVRQGLRQGQRQAPRERQHQEQPGTPPPPRLMLRGFVRGLLLPVMFLAGFALFVLGACLP